MLDHLDLTSHGNRWHHRPLAVGACNILRQLLCQKRIYLLIDGLFGKNGAMTRRCLATPAQCAWISQYIYCRHRGKPTSGMWMHTMHSDHKQLRRSYEYGPSILDGC